MIYTAVGLAMYSQSKLNKQIVTIIVRRHDVMNKNKNKNKNKNIQPSSYTATFNI